MEVWRKGASKTLQVTVAELVPEEASAQSEPKQMPPNRIGLALSDLTPRQKSQLKIEEGVLVRAVTGAAQRAGIQPGDIVLAVNDVPVGSVSAFEMQIARGFGNAVALLVKRGTDTLYVPLKLG
jgi:serine protease Do